MLPFCSPHPTSDFSELKKKERKNSLNNCINVLNVSGAVAELFQTPLAAGLSNNLMGTRSKCLWVKCHGPTNILIVSPSGCCSTPPPGELEIIPPPETEISCFVMLPFCSPHPTSDFSELKKRKRKKLVK